jgi:FkbM family methyltransferase
MGKLLRAPLRLIPRSMIVPILQGPLRGKKWIAGSSTHGCWLGSYELDKQRALRFHLKSGDVFYDIGANVGFYTMLASVLVGENGHIYSFEPSPDNLRNLKRHIQINHRTNCTLVEAAVSSVDGESGFDPTANRSTGHLASTGRIRVPTVTLDFLVRTEKFRPPNLMKIDIEGAERECLLGASSTIREFRPIIFLATHGWEVHSACTKLLQEWNYRLASLDDHAVEGTDELIARPSEFS